MNACLILVLLNSKNERSEVIIFSIGFSINCSTFKGKGLMRNLDSVWFVAQVALSGRASFTTYWQLRMVFFNVKFQHLFNGCSISGNNYSYKIPPWFWRAVRSVFWHVICKVKKKDYQIRNFSLKKAFVFWFLLSLLQFFKNILHYFSENLPQHENFILPAQKRRVCCGILLCLGNNIQHFWYECMYVV